MAGLFSMLLRPLASINTSAELNDFLRAGADTEAGEPVGAGTAMKYGPVFRAVHVLSTGVASLPLKVYERLERGKQLARTHPVHALLRRRPNPWQTPYEFRQMMQGHLCLRGNAFAWKNTVQGRVRELIPLHPDRIEVEQLRDYSLLYHYRGPTGDTRTFTQGEIFHLRGLSSDGIMGISILQAAREGIGIGVAGERHAGRFFRNASRPSGAFKLPNKLSDQAHARLKQDLERGTTGSNAYRVMLLEEGLDWVSIGLNNRDAQFLESRKWQVVEIARFFGVPPWKLYDTEGTKFNNGEQQSHDFLTDSLLPWLVNWEQRINSDLLAGGDRFFAEHLVNGLMRVSAGDRMNFYVNGINHGIISPNEAREFENLNPRPGGDEYRESVQTREPIAPANPATEDE